MSQEHTFAQNDPVSDCPQPNAIPLHNFGTLPVPQPAQAAIQQGPQTPISDSAASAGQANNTANAASGCCFNTFEPIDDFLQCHFEPGTWKEIESAAVTDSCDHDCPLGDPCPIDDSCLDDLCNFNSDGSRLCDVDVPDWTAMETCNSVIRCSPPSMTDSTPTSSTSASSASTTAATNGTTTGPTTMLSPDMLEPELSNVALPEANMSNKTSDMRDYLTHQRRRSIVHPERPHIHEHFGRQDPHHHYHLHYQNKLNGSVIQHDLILPPNFSFSQLGDPHCGVHDHLHRVPTLAKNGESTNVDPASSDLAGSAVNQNIASSSEHLMPSINEAPLPQMLQLGQFSQLSGVPQMPPEPPVEQAAKRQKLDNLVCKWDDCNSTLPTEDLGRHVLQQHLTSDYLQTSQNTYQCEWLDCMFSTNELDKLFEHIPDCHGAKKCTAAKSEPHSGNTCAHAHHQYSKNEGEDVKHVCEWEDPETHEVCGIEFNDTGALTDHIIAEHVKSGKSSYVCHWKDCPRGCRPFSQRQKIVRHLNTHTKHKPFKCEVCGKKFSLDLMLKQHMRIHTGERPYECKVCGKHFKTSSSLTIHSRIHSGDKPMVCNVCGKRFNESSNLNKHMKIHNRKFKCDICLKSFNTEGKYQKHLAVCSAKNRRLTKFQCGCCKDGEIVPSNGVIIKEEQADDE